MDPLLVLSTTVPSDKGPATPIEVFRLSGDLFEVTWGERRELNLEASEAVTFYEKFVAAALVSAGRLTETN